MIEEVRLIKLYNSYFQFQIRDGIVYLQRIRKCDHLIRTLSYIIYHISKSTNIGNNLNRTKSFESFKNFV